MPYLVYYPLSTCTPWNICSEIMNKKLFYINYLELNSLPSDLQSTLYTLHSTRLINGLNFFALLLIIGPRLPLCQHLIYAKLKLLTVLFKECPFLFVVLLSNRTLIFPFFDPIYNFQHLNTKLTLTTATIYFGIPI